MAMGNRNKSSRQTWLDASFCALPLPHPAGLDGCSCMVVEDFTTLGGTKVRNRSWARTLAKRPIYGLPYGELLRGTRGPSSTHNLIDDHGTDPRLPLRGGGSRARRIGMGLGRILGRMAHWFLAPTGEWGKPKKGDW